VAVAAGPLAFDPPSIELEKARITMSSTSKPGDFKAALDAMGNPENWLVALDKRQISVNKVLVDVRLESIYLELSRSDLPFKRVGDIGTDKLTVTYKPLSLQMTFAPPNNAAPPVSRFFLSRCLGYTFTGDKKNADIDITGGWQAGVAAQPQYYWSVKAACPMPLGDHARYGYLGPTFTGQASQQQNADPDSLKVGLTYRKDIAQEQTRNGWQVSGDALSYEFERNLKQEAALNGSGKPTEQQFSEKDTNLMWTGIVRYVSADPAVNWTIGFLGVEAGRSLSRTVKKASQGSSNQPVTRLHFDLNLYRSFFYKGNTFLTVHGYEDLRLPFQPEPYKEAGVNGGNLFLSSKPRHWSLVELTWMINKGLGINAQYKRGSLPPSFQFVNHQVTVGFNVELKQK
jgi:hypothetical protein